MRTPAIIVVSLVAASFAGIVRAQDLAVIAMPAPVDGCALGSSEPVTLRLFNHGTNLPAGTAFNVAYTVNAGAPISDMVVLGSTLPGHSTFTYTFTTPLDVSVPGTYTLDATVALAGDINPSNDTFAGHLVTNSATSFGGVVHGPGTPVLSGTVSLSGHTGTIVEWQQSADGGRRWRRLANSDALLAFDALRHDTAFRALVRNGTCPPALSDAFTVVSSDPIFYSGFEP
jgi:hypothetical protein